MFRAGCERCLEHVLRAHNVDCEIARGIAAGRDDGSQMHDRLRLIGAEDLAELGVADIRRFVGDAGQPLGFRHLSKVDRNDVMRAFQRSR